MTMGMVRGRGIEESFLIPINNFTECKRLCTYWNEVGKNIKIWLNLSVSFRYCYYIYLNISGKCISAIIQELPYICENNGVCRWNTVAVINSEGNIQGNQCRLRLTCFSNDNVSKYVTQTTLKYNPLKMIQFSQ